MIERVVTARGLFAPPAYSHVSVVEAGARLALLAGTVPLDADGALVGEGDPPAQARQVIANLRRQLAAVGSTLADVVRTEVYVVGDEPSVLARVWEVVTASGLAAGPHSSTLIGVACLGYPGQLVEITATAVAPEVVLRVPRRPTRVRPPRCTCGPTTPRCRRCGEHTPTTRYAGGSRTWWCRPWRRTWPSPTGRPPG